MTQRSVTPLKQASHVARAVDELSSTWATAFVDLDWPARLELLEQVDLQLQMSYKDPAIHHEISQAFTAHLIDLLPIMRVECVEQAYFFLNSARDEDRQAAQVGLIINKFDRQIGKLNTFEQAEPGTEKRAARRIPVNMRGLVAANDHAIEAKIIDVSRSGAKVAISHSLSKGARVVLDLALVGRVAAYVVWVAASFAGLAFVT